MNNVYILVILVIALIVIFFPGSKKTQREVEVEQMLNTDDYVEKKAEIGHDLMNKIVLATNIHISEKYKKPTYIIETIAAKKYEHPITKDVFYRCMFMVMSRKGFASGFTITVDIRVKPSIKIHAVTRQPIDVELPGDTKPYEQEGVSAQEFFKYELIKKKIQVTPNEFKVAKNKLN
jgi:hypothetical protein